MKLENKVALVTGSSQGIGQAIAIRLAQEGASVVINYRSHPEGAEETLRRVQEASGKCYMAQCPKVGATIQADLSSVREAQELVRESIEQFGKLDILVNNAGLEKNKDFIDVSEADYDKVLDVNLKGIFFTTQAFVKHLKETNRPGKVINISSVHEELPFPHFTAYCASKGGLKMMMRNLAIELAPLGVTVNNVAPGAIATPINKELLDDKEKLDAVLKNIPLGRLGKPEDVAGLVAFLASADADYTTGATYYVDGGLLWNYQEQ
ncbi:MAG: glucose 1-dehydrogenase [Oscillatoriophycideae cyanobacterium NC_groundwater_1537_Pr4_S-0.65um_50_18]|nr:glucose 1-dehydrogenase [Oscillatoriophycideae cyanobacterium NC_groundwater_1537_Pr4_S-0.65um_50_18]